MLTSHENAISPQPHEDFDVILEAGRTEQNYWLDLWKYRELFLILAMRDISVRYKQTVIGILWAVIQPFLTMVVMTFIFGKVAGLHSDGAVPYALMVLVAMLPWIFFSSSLTSASQSMIGNANLISKVYFPRLIIPTSAVVTSGVDFLVSFIILLGLMLWYQFLPAWQIVLLPIFSMLAFFAALGPGLFIASLNVKYRDFRYVIPFFTQFGLYITPVGFSSHLIRDKLGETFYLIYCINPMVGVIDCFRWSIFGNNSPIDLGGLSISISMIFASMLLGIIYFRKTENSLADII